MKIPRLTSGPLCWTLEQWAIRMAFSDLTLGLVLAVFFFYASTLIDDVGSATSTQEVKDASAVGKGILIALGVIFIIPAIFGIVLLVGLLKNITKLLLIWCFYAIAGCFLFFIFLFAVSIMVFVSGDIGLGFGVIAIAVIISGHLFYSVLVVHSIYMKIKEAEVTFSHAQNS